MKLEDLDKNFISLTTSGEELDFYSAKEDPIKIHGLAYYDENREFIRIKESFHDNLSENNRILSYNTAGVCARFKTNSATIAIKAILSDDSCMSHMPRTGSAGFDVFADGIFRDKAVSSDQSNIIDHMPKLKLNTEEKEVTVNFPLYNGVKELYIGLDKGSTISAPKPYSIEKPVLFYGSSITQGACASRPGNAYTNLISRWLDVPIINMGFSGGAKGEPFMAKLISDIDMSCFVMDYDFNSPSPEHLLETHEPFFKIIREKHPDLPIIITSRASQYTTERRNAIYKTYENAIKNGDKNVYFLDGEEMFANVDRNVCTVDRVHPNDMGFYFMGLALCPLIKKVLNI